MKTRFFGNLKYYGMADLVVCCACQGDEYENMLVPVGYDTCPVCGEHGFLQDFDDVVRSVDLDEYLATHDIKPCLAEYEEVHDFEKDVDKVVRTRDGKVMGLLL